MECLILFVATLIIATLTFLTGFGLGTLLLPIFILFFPVDTAIAATAVVHLANNIFQTLIIGKKANLNVVFRFTVPAALFAVIGAFALNGFTHLPVLFRYSLTNHRFSVTPVKVVISVFMGLFAFVELSPWLRELSFSSRFIPFGGAISGFFGGLTGHQGALRSAFLIGMGMEKEVYLGTVAISSVIVDVSRLSIYGMTFFSKGLMVLAHQNKIDLIVAACLAALVGPLLGYQFIKKITLQTVRLLIGTLLIVYSLGLGVGVI